MRELCERVGRDRNKMKMMTEEVVGVLSKIKKKTIILVFIHDESVRHNFIREFLTKYG